MKRFFIQCVALMLLPLNSLRAQQPGSVTFASNCAGCHGADGRGGEHAPNIATAAEVKNLADSTLAGIIHNGISGAGMPAFPSLKQTQVDQLIGYLRMLQGRGPSARLPGDADRGEALFYGKAHCADCHMVHGKGGFLGSELSYYGAGAKAEQIRAIILDPEANLHRGHKATTVVTYSGETVTGMLKSSDNFSLSLQTLDGTYRSFPRSELSRVDYDTRSLMLKGAFTDAEVNDLVSYLLRTGNNGSKPKEEPDNDDN